MQSQAAGKVQVWLGILTPTWQGLEYGSYGSFAAADPDEGHARMTDAAEAVQNAALQQGFQPRVAPSGMSLCCLRSVPHRAAQPARHTSPKPKGSVCMTHAAEAVQNAALQEGFERRVTPSKNDLALPVPCSATSISLSWAWLSEVGDNAHVTESAEVVQCAALGQGCQLCVAPVYTLR